jgi:hypothetical protein
MKPIEQPTIVESKELWCLNGWNPTAKYPACNYTGGHFCDRKRGHNGRCKCVCGSQSSTVPPKAGRESYR